MIEQQTKFDITMKMLLSVFQANTWNDHSWIFQTHHPSLMVTAVWNQRRRARCSRWPVDIRAALFRPPEILLRGRAWAGSNVAKYGENATQFPWLQMRETMINRWTNQANLSLVLPFSTTTSSNCGFCHISKCKINLNPKILFFLPDLNPVISQETLGHQTRKAVRLGAFWASKRMAMGFWCGWPYQNLQFCCRNHFSTLHIYIYMYIYIYVYI